MNKLLEQITKKKMNKKGFSLVEMICVLAILAVVGIVIGGFISMSSKTYKEANINIEMSKDAQEAMNQIKNVIMEANSGISMIDDATGKYLVIYNLEETPDPSGTGTVKKYNVIKIENRDNSLFYGETTYNALSDIDIPSITSDNLMAKNIDSFTVDTTKVESDEIATVSISFDSEGQTYSVTNKVTLRNRIVASVDKTVVYSGGRVERSNYVNSVKIIYMNREYPNDGTVDPGFDRPVGTSRQYAFRAEVEAYGYYGTSVDWELIGGDGKTPTSKIEDGILTLEPNEPNTRLIVRATTVGKDLEGNKKVADLNIPIVWGYAINLNVVPTAGTYPKQIINNVTGGIIEYEFKANIQYKNESKLSSSEMGYKLTVESLDGTPVDTANIVKTGEGSETLRVTCNPGATNKSFKVVAVSKSKDVNGNYLRAEYPVNIPTLLQPNGAWDNNDANVSWGGMANGASINRDAAYTLTAEAKNLKSSTATYTWKVNSSSNYITVNNSNQATGTSATLKVDKNYDWNTATDFSVEVTISGVRSDGSNTTVTYTSTWNFHVPKVELVITGRTPAAGTKITMSKVETHGCFGSSEVTGYSGKAKVSIDIIGLVYKDEYCKLTFTDGKNTSDPYSFSGKSCDATFQVPTTKPQNVDANVTLYRNSTAFATKTVKFEAKYQ